LNYISFVSTQFKEQWLLYISPDLTLKIYTFFHTARDYFRIILRIIRNHFPKSTQQFVLSTKMNYALWQIIKK